MVLVDVILIKLKDAEERTTTINESESEQICRAR